MLFTVREAGLKIGVCERTTWTYIKQGRLHAIRLSPKLTRISEAAILKFFADCGVDEDTLELIDLDSSADAVHAA